LVQSNMKKQELAPLLDDFDNRYRLQEERTKRQVLGYIDYYRLIASLPTATDPEAYCGPP
jgi:predicted outer membrane protein